MELCARLRIRGVDRYQGPADDWAVNSEHEMYRVAQVIDHLAEKFPEFDLEEVEYQVNPAYQAFAVSPILEYLPILVEHGAKAKLRRPIAGDPMRAHRFGVRSPIASTSSNSVLSAVGIPTGLAIRGNRDEARARLRQITDVLHGAVVAPTHFAV